jgi:hypothetical protein
VVSPAAPPQTPWGCGAAFFALFASHSEAPLSPRSGEASRALPEDAILENALRTSVGAGWTFILGRMSPSGSSVTASGWRRPWDESTEEDCSRLRPNGAPAGRRRRRCDRDSGQRRERENDSLHCSPFSNSPETEAASLLACATMLSSHTGSRSARTIRSRNSLLRDGGGQAAPTPPVPTTAPARGVPITTGNRLAPTRASLSRRSSRPTRRKPLRGGSRSARAPLRKSLP